MIEILYKKYYKFLFAVAFNLCNSYHVAEDILQDAFINMLTCKIIFTDIEKAKQYMCAIIRYSAYRRFGKEKRDRAMIKDFLYCSKNTVKSSLESQVLANVSKIKSTMTRVIIKEIYFHCKTYKQIEQQYQVSHTHISKLHKIGLSELSKKLTYG